MFDCAVDVGSVLVKDAELDMSDGRESIDPVRVAISQEQSDDLSHPVRACNMWSSSSISSGSL